MSAELEWATLGFIRNSWRVLDHRHCIGASRFGVSGRRMMTMMMKTEHATTRDRRRRHNNHLKAHTNMSRGTLGE